MPKIRFDASITVGTVVQVITLTIAVIAVIVKLNVAQTKLADQLVALAHSTNEHTNQIKEIQNALIDIKIKQVIYANDIQRLSDRLRSTQ